MAEQRFRALSSCLVIVWLVGIGTTENNVPERRIHVNYSIHANSNAKMANETRRNTCVPAHVSPSSDDVCKPYMYGEKGVCSSIIGDRLTYTSQKMQEKFEKRLMNVVALKIKISDRCLPTLKLVYCNYYFQICDNATPKIRPVNICREACDVMNQQHCEKEIREAHKINKGFASWYFDLINCTTLPRRNGGTIPECYFPRELDENITREDLSDVCSYGDGQSYRGNVSMTQSGYTCQSWPSQCPHRHRRTPDNFPELKDAGNACRNPGGQAPRGPWCYTTNASVRWEYCNISTCPPEDATLSDWSPFTNCSVSCGTGFKTRYRSCNRSRYGGKDCASLGALIEQQPCNVHNCSGTAEVAVEEKPPKGLTFMVITMAGGLVVFILVVTLVAVLFKKHKGRKRNIPDSANEEKITSYATVRISRIFALNAENSSYGPPGMCDNAVKALPFQPRTPLGERAADGRELLKSLYENTDHLGKPSVTPLEYLLFEPRYENEAANNDVVMIRPGYDKLALGPRADRRLPCGMVDKHGQFVYDSLIREIHLKCKSPRVDE